MKNIFSILALMAALVLAAPAPTMAASKKKSDATADEKKTDDKSGEKKKDTYPFYGEVTDVSDSALILKKEKGERKIELNAETKFKNGKESATIKDVKKGAWVGGSVKKTPDGKGEIALSVNVGVKQKAEKKEDKAASTEKKTDTDKAAPAKPDTTKKKKKEGS